MPRDYQNGKIYKIWSVSTDEIYVGSTVQSLSRRMTGHRRNYKHYLNGKGNFVSSYKILDYGNAKIELVEKFGCSCKEELLAREGHFIRTLNCVNLCIAGRTQKQYREDNKESIRDKKKRHYEDNRDKILCQRKEYREVNREKLRQYYEDNRESILDKSRQYYEDNKESILDKKKQYREDNRESIRDKSRQYYEDNKGSILDKKKQYYQTNKENFKQTITCECGSVVAKGNLTKHKKSKKHLSYGFD